MNKKTSGKDTNDALMRIAGFVRDLEWDSPEFNACGNITYWINELGIKIITNKKHKISLEELVNQVAKRAAYLAEIEIKDKIVFIHSDLVGWIRA